MDDRGSHLRGTPGGDGSGSSGDVPRGVPPPDEDHEHDSCGFTAAGEHAAAGQRTESGPGGEPTLGVASNAIGVARAE